MEISKEFLESIDWDHWDNTMENVSYTTLTTPSEKYKLSAIFSKAYKYTNAALEVMIYNKQNKRTLKYDTISDVDEWVFKLYKTLKRHLKNKTLSRKQTLLLAEFKTEVPEKDFHLVFKLLKSGDKLGFFKNIGK